MNKILSAAIFGYLIEHPESRIDAIATGVGKPPQQVRKCLTRMEFIKDVISERSKRPNQVGASYKVWSINPTALEPAPLNELEQRKVNILTYLHTHPHSSVRDMCQSMHLRKGQVQYAIQGLSKDKIIDSKEEMVKRKGLDVIRHLWYVYADRQKDNDA